MARSASTIVDTEAHVLACYRYIEAAPVRARRVERAKDHFWSSHGAKALGRHDPLVTRHECYRALGGTELARRAAYR